MFTTLHVVFCLAQDSFRNLSSNVGEELVEWTVHLRFNRLLDQWDLNFDYRHYQASILRRMANMGSLLFGLPIHDWAFLVGIGFNKKRK